MFIFTWKIMDLKFFQILMRLLHSCIIRYWKVGECSCTWKAEPEKVVLLVLPHAGVPRCQVAGLDIVAVVVVVVLVFLGGHHEQLGLLHLNYPQQGRGIDSRVLVSGHDSLFVSKNLMFYNNYYSSDLTITYLVSYRLSLVVQADLRCHWLGGNITNYWAIRYSEIQHRVNHWCFLPLE